MKKLLLALVIAASFAVVSCGSKTVEVTPEVEEVEEVVIDSDETAITEEVVDGEEGLETPVVE
jgi:uncharacterized protein YcfL